MSILFKKFLTKEIIFLTCIVLLAAVLRFYKLSYVVGYDFDQEYANMFAVNVVTVYPIQMIGQGLSVQGLFMGPWYFYYLVPFFIATGLAPIGGYVGSIILGLITLIVEFYVFKKIFTTRTAFLLIFLRAILFNFMTADWSMAPSYSSELAVVLTWYFLYKFWHGNKKAILPVSFLAGLYTSFHPILFPFILIILLIIIIKWKFFNLKLLPLAIILFLVPISPLLRFEYYHHFLEVKQLFTLSHTNKGETKTLATFLDYIKLLFFYPYNFLRFPDNMIFRLMFSFGTFMFVVWNILKKNSFWEDFFHIFIFVVTPLIFLLYYYFLPIHVPDYYFLGAQLLYFFYVFATFESYFKTVIGKVFLFALLVIILYVNFPQLLVQWRYPVAMLGNKEDMVKYILLHEKNNPYDVIYVVDQGWQFGYGQLFRYYTNYYNIHANNNPVKHTYYIVLRKQAPPNAKLVYKSGGLELYVQQM